MSLKTYSENASKLKKTALTVFVKSIKDKDIQHLKKQFEIMDVDHTGLIDKDELTNAVQAAGIDMTKEEIE
jgi:Ca2+-binding EF-hand superfamily protein